MQNQIDENKELANTKIENLVKEVSDLVDTFFTRINLKQERAETDYKSLVEKVENHKIRI